ncbi:two-component system, NtrC family, sensor kinase [Maridesulfovibrio ferrireducens]|uniref:histidine kinase n=1 Tax=Maridesulfovibrio ferrireducens TaxID=246191 RepID=A0A1G9L7J2_9BACT|nr:PAS domain-containing sensor histidine kinase [Maridesulfovibrio ferrireducens]SDL57959.1 two-component system, NtrC family, sensor kinase [Maridesulfovibrio ferrireducens]
MTSTSYTKLRWKLIAITLCFSLIPLFALGYVIHDQFSKSYEEKLTSNLVLVVNSKRDTIDMFLNERVVQLQNLANTHTLAQMTDQTYLNSLFDIIHNTSRSFIDLGVIGPDGSHEAYSGPFDLRDVNYKDEAWFNQVMLKGVYVSDVFMGFRNFPHFIIAVKRREAGKTWILRATIDSDVFTTLVRNVRSGKLGDAYLVNRNWELQTSSRFGGKVLSKATLPEYSGGRPVDICKWTESGTTHVAAITSLSLTDWKLVVTESPGEELSPLLRVQSMVYLLFLVCACMIFVGTYLTVASVVGKLKAANDERAALDATIMQSSKMASLGKMAAGVAHEINNPLSIIRESAGWIRDLINDGELDGFEALDDLNEAVSDIDRHVERARTVTHRMLGFARRMEPAQEDVDLNILAKQTVAFLENEIKYRNIEVVFDLDSNLPLITTDSNQVQQIILNLLENSIDAVAENGSITLESRVEGSFIAMGVKDTGTGILPDQLTKVFDPFFTTKSAGEGTGLGLSIIYSTLNKLGGKITVQSEHGQGAVFTFFLPLSGVVHDS